MTIEGLSIDEVVEDDLLEFAQLKALDDAEATQSKVNEERALERVVDFWRSEMQMWLARLHGEAVGYWIGKQEGLDAYRSNGIFVKKESRGNGIGSELKQSQVAYASDAGFAEIYSKTKNEHARRILLALGFQYDEREDLYSLPIK